MPQLAKHQSAESTKLLLIGDSGSGKTGSLAALAADGYNLRILDFDNGLDILKSFLTEESSPYVKQNPKAIENVHYITLMDKMKNVNGLLMPVKAEAWQKAMMMLHHWKEDGIDLGPVTSWGTKDVLVVDSFSMMSNAAYNFALALNSMLGKNPTQNEARRMIYQAQTRLKEFLQMLYDKSIQCNVVVTSHITKISETGNRPGAEEDKGEEVTINGYPASVGRALSPEIPRYFNSVLIARPYGAGRGIKHKIYTNTTAVSGQLINGKNSAPLRVRPEYDLSNGLAEYFRAVRQ